MTTTRKLMQAGIEGFKDSFRLVAALVMTVAAVIGAFAAHQSLQGRDDRAHHDSKFV